MNRPDPELAQDVAAASAAYLLTMLPAIMRLPRDEAFERLTMHFEAAISAYLDGVRGWELPAPSGN